MARKSKQQVEADIVAQAEADETLTYDESAVQEPARIVDIPTLEVPQEGQSSANGTLSAAIDNSSDLSDMQSAQKKLFPPELGGDVYNHIMISRVDPNSYLPRLHLNANDEIMHQDPLKSIDVNKIWQKHDILLSIGLDGMGRIDDLELAGASREEKRFQKGFGALGV